MRPARKPSRKLKFLVVDDMSNMRKTIRNMLRKLGYDDVTEAEDGDTALSRLKASRYDFVIADWNMPRMSGFELLMAVREDEALRNIPFLIVTAEINEATVAQAAEGEVDGYIIKPFFAMTLEEKINGILERRANPSQLEQHLRKARACLADGQLNQALAACEEALGLQPTSARAMTLMAEIFEKKGQPEQAEQSYKAALHHNPMFIKAHDQLGHLCERQGKRKEALEAFQAAVRISPSNSDRQMELGKALLEE
ncbi:MAG: response regulator, partial [Nitrospinota bacterium]